MSNQTLLKQKSNNVSSFRCFRRQVGFSGLATAMALDFQAFLLVVNDDEVNSNSSGDGGAVSVYHGLVMRTDAAGRPVLVQRKSKPLALRERKRRQICTLLRLFTRTLHRDRISCRDENQGDVLKSRSATLVGNVQQASAEKHAYIHHDTAAGDSRPLERRIRVSPSVYLVY